MGRFVNPDNSAFQVALNSRIYMDKTGLIEYTNSVLDTTNAYICNSRPRRFGKSYAANMLAAYYSKGADSEQMFSGLQISREADFKKHLNKYDVIRVTLEHNCIIKKHRKYIGKRAGKGYNVRESVIDKIQTFFSALSGHK